MRILLTISFFLLLRINCQSQVTAVTSNGEEVILFNNGTWKYANKTDSVKKIIQTNKENFTRKSESTFQVKSNVISSVSVYVNPKVWSFEKGEAGAASEYRFTMKGKDGYGMMISERVEIPLETLKTIALQNAKEAAPDIQLIKEEYRMVNGKKVLFMQMNGTIQGISFAYYGYYYSSKSGSLQLLTYTAQSLLAEYKPDFETFLNGLMIAE